MPTMKKRINISLPKEIDAVLTAIAERDAMPTATKAVELLRLALVVDEDDCWDRFAGERDTKSARFVAHKKAWG